MSDESPAAILYDAQGNPVLVSSDGVYALSIRDEETLQAMQGIASELRKIRFLLEMGMGSPGIDPEG